MQSMDKIKMKQLNLKINHATLKQNKKVKIKKNY